MSEISTLLAETCARLFADLVTADSLRAAEAGAWPGDLWSALEENGLTRALVPEADGGAGVTWQDAAPILHAAGYHGAPVPLAESIVAGWLLARAGEALAAGKARLTEPLLWLTTAVWRSTDRTSQAVLSGCRGARRRRILWLSPNRTASRCWFCWGRGASRRMRI